ncbi:MAG TPA: hypothetical protein VF622_04585 [Segetibacter sp.]|jgi:hypothetical protein
MEFVTGNWEYDLDMTPYFVPARSSLIHLSVVNSIFDDKPDYYSFENEIRGAHQLQSLYHKLTSQELSVVDLWDYLSTQKNFDRNLRN